MQQLDSLVPNRAHDPQHSAARHRAQVASHSVAPADTLLDPAPDPGTDGQPISDSVIPRVSRGKDMEIFVATRDSRCNAGSDRIGSPIQAAVILFAIIIAMCLAVANVLVSTGAVAVAPDRSLMPALVVAAANPPVDAGKSTGELAGQVSERTENSRGLKAECDDRS